MARARKACLGVLALILALGLGFALAGCGEKDTEPTYGYGEEGYYYYSASESEDYLLTLSGGSFILEMGTSGFSGTYKMSGGTVTFYEEGEETGTGYATETGFGLTYGGRSYLFLRYEFYTVTFTDGSATVSTQSVLNGKAAQDPGEAEKDGYVFLGWYADSAFTTKYEFNTAITSNTTIHARFVEASGTAEYKITFDYTGETTETINGVVYNLPEPEREGYTFIGWWVSATNNPDELTYKYDGEQLYEDTTLFAFFVAEGASYVGASVYDDGITWENYNAAVTEIILRDENGMGVERFTIQSTDQKYAYDFSSLPVGKYTLTIQGGGIDENLVYVSNGLARVSGFTVISGSIFMYSPVENAERYYVTIECGDPTHGHTLVDNGTSLYYDFSSCDMPIEGITFTVYAYADGYYTSVSSYNYFLGLDKTEVMVEGNEISWDAVAHAMQYEVYIDGVLVTTTSDTSYSLSNYGTGTYEISVKPVTTGYYSEASETISFTKTTLAAPEITGIADYTITWTEVEGATGYIVRIGDTETTVETGTSLILTDDNYTKGLDEYEISVKAMAADSNNDSPYGDAITVTGTSVGSAVSYSNGTVTWQYSLSASEYRVTVNDGDETIVTGTNSSAVTLTKSGNNEITIYFVNDEGDVYGTASVTVYAYAVVFDARGGSAYLNGEEIDTIYVAKGDAVTLPDADRGVVLADFIGWYTLPDTTNDPDAVDYQGDGYLFEDGTVFTGNATLVLYAVWLNPRMNVRLDVGSGTLVDANGDVISDTMISFNGKNYTIAVPESADAAYVFYGWYSGENGTGTRYTDENGNACATFNDETVTTLYARWIEVLSFSTVVYNTQTVLSAEKGPDIDLVSEVTVPEAYTLNGTEYTTQYIGSTAFASCTNLKTINIPDTVIYLQITNNGYSSGTGIFAGTALENVNVYATGEPSTTKEIIYYSNDGVLYWINTTTGDVELLYYPYGRTDETYEIPDTVQNENELELSGNREVPVVHTINAVGNSAFREHTELVYMVIPDNIDTLGTYTFYNCTSLESLEFEGDIETLPDYMLYGCSSMTDFEIPSSVKELGGSVFRNCNGFTTFIIPDNVESIGTYLFAADKNLVSVQISGNLTVLNDRIFYGCSALKGVIIPYSVTTIGEYAFYDCTALVSITIPDSVTSLGQYVFYGCAMLEDVTLSSNIDTIPSHALDRCYGLEYMELPDSVTTLGTYAFYYCTALREIELSSSLTTINNYAFQRCSSLESIYLPDTVTSLGQYSFDYCSSLTYVHISENLKTISSYAFRYCSSLTSVTIPASVTAINTDAFRYDYRLVEIHNLSSLDIVAGATTYGYVAQNAVVVYKTGDSHIVEDENGFMFISDSEGSYYLFGYAGPETESLTLPDTIYGEIYEINAYAFYECDYLVFVVIPEGVTGIGNYAFGGCSSLAEIVIPDSVTRIGEYAFQNCYGLVDITLGKSVSNIGTNAFQNCYKLIEIYNRSSLELTKGSSDYGGVAYYAKNIYTAEGGSTIIRSGDFGFVRDEDGSYFLVGYYGNASDITLPSSADGHDYAITAYMFYRNSSITSVTIPDSVTAIEKYAFYSCRSLETVTVGSGVTSIGEYGFSGCAALKEIILPDNLTTIGESAFESCESLTYAYLGSSLKSIEYSTFNYCPYLKEIVIPDSVAYIDMYAFSGCYMLETLVIGNGVKEIGECAFEDCEALKSIVIPDSVEIIGYGAFSYCLSAETLVLGNRLIEIGESAFSGCAITSVVIPDSVVKIGQYSFSGCPIEYLVIGNSVEEIGEYVFNGCLITELVLPDSLKKMSSGVFQNCSNLVDITLGTGLLEIGNNCFSGTAYYNDQDNWEDGYLYIGNYLIAASSTSGAVTIKDGTLAIAARVFYSNTSITSVVMPDSVRGVGTYCFYNCSGLTSITTSKNLVYIGSQSFRGCSKVTTIDIPDTVTEIGTHAFYGDSALTSVNIPSGLTEIGTYTFYNCSSLTSIVIPDSVTTIGTYVFYGCSKIESVTMSANVTSIGNYAFYNCSSLTSIVIPDTVTSLGTYCFYGCTKLESVTLGNSIKEIGTYTFYNCTSLKSIVIPESVTSIGTYAFSGCTSLADITIVGSNLTTISQYAFNNTAYLNDSSNYEDGVAYIGNYLIIADSSISGEVVIKDGTITIANYAFNNISAVTSIVIPDTVQYIGTYAFRGTSIKSVVIPDSVVSIGNYAFYQCTSLTSVVIFDSVTSLGTYCFSGCTSLTSVVIGGGITEIGSSTFQNCSKLSAVYYMGTEEDWDSLTISSSNNSYLTDATRYYYSETEPTEDGNWWHYDDEGNPVVW